MYPNGNILSKNTIEAATGGVLLRKGVLRNFAKFTGKHLCQISAQINGLTGFYMTGTSVTKGLILMLNTLNISVYVVFLVKSEL